MIYAPIIIPTLCRYEHFKACIESLNNNEWAKFTDVYVGIDYPKSQSHWDGYIKIKEYLKKASFDFRELIVIERVENYGASKNCLDLFETVKKKSDCYILTEDDNVFSPCFIEYIDRGLQITKDDDSIFAVCGYSYPVNFNIKNSNVFKEHSFFPAWGYGAFFEKIESLRKDISQSFFYEVAKNKRIMRRIRRESPMNYAYFLGMLWKNEYGYSDIHTSLCMNVKQKNVLMPYISLVRNCGWDGSGLHCKDARGEVFMQQEISVNHVFGDIYSIDDNAEADKILNVFWAPNCSIKIKTFIKAIILKFRGIL